MRIPIALITSLLVCAPARAQVHVMYDPPPATEAGYFSNAIVVLRGRVEARHLESAPGPITSIYRVRIGELLKDDGRHAVGQVIDVHRNGGLEPTDAERNFPPFEIDDDVVLFLQRGDNGWYWPLSGPYGAFKVAADGRIHAYGINGAISRRQHGRPVGEFLAEWRTHRK